MKQLFQFLDKFIPISLLLTSVMLLAACAGGDETAPEPVEQAPAPVTTEAPISDSLASEPQPAEPTQAAQSNSEPTSSQENTEEGATSEATEPTVAPVSETVVVSISALPLAPSVENVGYADRATWSQFLNVPVSCEEEFLFVSDYYQEQNRSGITFYNVEPQKYVVEVLCATFAYSFHSRLYLYNAQTQSSKPLILQEVAPDGTIQDTDVLFSSGFDQTASQFTNFQKGRGLGDCGALYTYQFASDNLTLLEARYRACSETEAGEEYVEPSEWDVIYP